VTLFRKGIFADVSKDLKMSPDTVTHPCNPNYSSGGDQSWFKTSQGKKLARLHLNKQGMGNTPVILTVQEAIGRRIVVV
jgi:hypothetical protein